MNSYTESFIQEAASYGYTVRAIQEVPYAYGGLKVYFNNPKGRFSPTVYEEYSFDDKVERPSYSIQTTSYGALSLAEIDEVIEGFQKAQGMARLLEGADYDQLTPYLHPELAARRAALWS